MEDGDYVALKFDVDPFSSPPNLEGIVDKDILDQFSGCSVMYGDIINAQLCRNTARLIELLIEAKERKYGSPY